MKNIAEFEKALDSAITCVKEKGWTIQSSIWIDAEVEYEDKDNAYKPTGFNGVGACCPIGAYFVCERPKEALIIADGAIEYIALAAKRLRVSEAKVNSFIYGFDSDETESVFINAEKKLSEVPSYYDLGRKFRTKYCG